MPQTFRLNTRLEPSRLKITIDPIDGGEPLSVMVNSGHVVLTRDGEYTGLAISPGLSLSRTAPGEGMLYENSQEWWVVHIPSGRTISRQGYGNRDDAHRLADKLVREIDWTRDQQDIGPDDVEAANEILDGYDRSCDEDKASVFATGTQAAR